MTTTLRQILIVRGPIRADISPAGRLQLHFDNLTVGMPPDVAHDLMLSINHALLETVQLDDELLPPEEVTKSESP